MKTAGELLKEKRLVRELEIEAVAAKIKVKVEYLVALENSDFNALPTSTVTKGFLRNYATILRLNPDTVLAMFRRDFEERGSGEIIPRGLVEPIAKKPLLISASSVLITLTIISFLGFLGFQLKSWWSLPSVKILQPENNEVYGEKITVKGKADKDAVVEVNDQQVIVTQDGLFSLDLIFPAGTHSIKVEATNRQGKSRLVERTFTVSK